MADMKRKSCMMVINDLTDTELKNFEKLLKSQKARKYLANDIQFLKLKPFI